MRYKIINKLTREKILNSDEFKRMSPFTYKEISESICSLDSVGGLIRGIPHKFICLVQKMEAISLRENVAASILEDMKPEEVKPVYNDNVAMVSTSGLKGNVYLIMALLLYLRLSEHFDEYTPLIRSFLVDFRKVPMVDEQNVRTFIYLDVFVDDLLNRNRVLSIHMNTNTTSGCGSKIY